MIVAECGYSRETVRKALLVLRGEGRIIVVLGVGTYVSVTEDR